MALQEFKTPRLARRFGHTSIKHEIADVGVLPFLDDHQPVHIPFLGDINIAVNGLLHGRIVLDGLLGALDEDGILLHRAVWRNSGARAYSP